MTTLSKQQELEAQFVMNTYKRKPVAFVRGQGMRLYDDEDKEYLDFIAGIGAVSVGHSNPSVVEAMQKQAVKLMHVSNYYHVEGRGELAEKLSMLLSESAVASGLGASSALVGGLGAGSAKMGEASITSSFGISAKPVTCWKSFFANSGTEAIEGAIKIARKYGERELNGADTIVCMRRSFHGRTLAALAATGQASKQESFAPLPQGFLHVELNNIAALKQVLNQGLGGAQVCAVLLECVQGEGGVYPASKEYIQAARQLTAEKGILLMVDEVQTGFYRLGSHPFAFQHFGIVPDVVALAKGIANGMPMGVVAATGAAAQILEPGDHGSTFGGSALAIAAANATLDELLAMQADRHVKEVGDYLIEQLADLAGKGVLKELRGKGLMIGLEFVEPIAERIVDAALERGLLINNIGHYIVRVLPPLVCTKEDAGMLVKELKSILEEL